MAVYGGFRFRERSESRVRRGFRGREFGVGNGSIRSLEGETVGSI